MAYTKLHSSLVGSSLWTQPDPVRILFITLLAMSDREGYVYGSKGGLARIANISRERASAAWKTLLGPDPDSSDRLRNADADGRRVEEVAGGFRLVNYPYYRGLRDDDERRAQTREAVARHRAMKQAAVSHGKPQKAHAEAEAEAEAEHTPLPPSEGGERGDPPALRTGRKPQPYDGDSDAAQAFRDFVSVFPKTRQAGLPCAWKLWAALSLADRDAAYEGVTKELYERRDARPPTLEFFANVTKWLKERRWERLTP